MTVSSKGKEWQDRWWEVRMIVKPRLYNSASAISRKRWKHIKRELKRELEQKGFEATLKLADYYEKRYA